MNTFFGVTSKKGLYVFFCTPWAPFFEIKRRWAPFLTGFSGILPRFSANQNFWGCANQTFEAAHHHLQHHCFS